MKDKLKHILTELRQALEKLYGDRLSRLILFGSQARGDAEEGSDIDIMVVLKGNVHHGTEVERAGDITASLSLSNDIVISCIYLSEERFHNESNPLLRNVRREGLAL